MDEAVFEGLVSTHYEGLFRFALSLVRRGEEAADLTQETFYRYATKGSQLRDSSKAKSWLYTTLYRQFLMGRRRETRFPHVELNETQPDLPVVEPDLVSRLDSAVVLEALGDLDETYRAPLTLFYLGDHSYKEIAGILDVPIGTVMSRLSRGKAMLRTRLATALKNTGDKIIALDHTIQSRSSTS
jgi:RNA polymerase sigma-70 factor (ECF subfamily)